MLSIWIPQLAAFLAAVVVAWAAQHNLTLDQTQVTGIFVAVFGTVKTLISRYMNPGNVAAPELVDQPKAEARRARAAKATRRSRVI